MGAGAGAGAVEVVEQKAPPVPQIGPVVIELQGGAVAKVGGQGIPDGYCLLDILLAAARMVTAKLSQDAAPQTGIVLAHQMPKPPDFRR